ncbi:hypothetical protein EYC80_003866 [Monilinia laxa]|uniref:MARVEL domain-containing protein n=1 Tax=Monilinia laxa TaxID=61186 RepID=A0A5N6KL03_MONLA|nr:hypothetical protein EYC80_003866 [Monilinia laxa]
MYSPKGKEEKYGTFGFAFTITRALQAVCLICILGISANFIGEINAVYTAPPSVLIATLSIDIILIVCLVIMYLLYLEEQLPFLIATGFDSAALIALIIVSVKVGLPLSYLDCPALANTGVTSAFVQSAVGNFSKINVNYYFWVGASKTACYEMKAVWGFSIALCVLFFFSGIINLCIWKKNKEGDVSEMIDKGAQERVEANAYDGYLEKLAWE